MSQSDETDGVQGIADDQLPDDLNPDENPMAGGLDAGETVDDLMTGGKQAEESEQAGQPGQPEESADSPGGDGAS